MNIFCCWLIRAISQPLRFASRHNNYMPPAERHFVLLHHKAVPASAAHTSRHCPKTQCILPATPQRQNCVRWLFPRSFYVRHGFAFFIGPQKAHSGCSGRGAVIHQYKLPVAKSLIQHRFNAPVKILFAIIYRYDYTDCRHLTPPPNS